MTYKRVTTTAAALEAVAQVPMTIAVDASGAFGSYRSGVMNSSSGCGTGLNHAITVVGYTLPDVGPDPEPPTPSNCTVNKWWHSCDSGNRLLADSNGNSNYWKVQNSWGTGWGDQGFILLEITEGGPGICGMHSYMEYATVNN